MKTTEEILAEIRKRAKIDVEVLLDRQPLNFGKWKGQTPKEIAKIAPSYLVWARGEGIVCCSDKLLRKCKDAVADELDANVYSGITDADLWGAWSEIQDCGDR
jgi:hypothetical protein